MKKRILVTDDDTELRMNICEVLNQDFECVPAENGRAALEAVMDGYFNVALVDLMLPDMSGLDVLKALKKQSPKTKIIMITAFATIGNAVEAVKQGACDYIAKPFKIDVLMTAVRRALEEAKFEEDVKKLDLDFTLSSLSNPIRRGILTLLEKNPKMRLTDLCRELDIEDHTKVVFHLRNLKENGIISQNDDKTYSLTKEGNKSLLCLKMFKRHLMDENTPST